MDSFNPSSLLSTQDINIIRVKATELVENKQLHQNIIKLHHAECKKNPQLDNIRSYKRIREATLYTLHDVDNSLDLGIILTSKLNEKVHYIEYMDSMLKGNHICEKMIHKYMSQFDKLLIPYEIINGSSIYWLKYYYTYGFTSFDMLMLEFLKQYSISPNEVKWGLLEYQYDNFANYLEISKNTNALEESQISETFKKFRKVMTHVHSFINIIM
jgi:hypothetical protein